MTSTSLTPARSGATVDPSTVLARSMFAFTASALNGVPSWNVTPSRRVMSSTVASSLNVQSVASIGTSSPWGLNSTSRS